MNSFSIPTKRGPLDEITETYDFHGYKLAEVCRKFQRPMALYLQVESRGKMERRIIVEEVTKDDVFHKCCVETSGWCEYATAFETLEDMKKGIELIRDVK